MSTSNTFISRVIGFSLASWVNCLISLIATPITTSLFPPEEMGKISLFISYANVLIPFLYMGFDQAYVRFYNEPCGQNDKQSLFKLCSYITLLFAVPVIIVLTFGWKYFSKSIIGYPNVFVTISLAVYLIASLFSRLCNLKSRMDNNVKLFCIQSICSTIIIKISFIVVAVVKPIAEYAIHLRSFLLLSVFAVFFVKALKECINHPVDYGIDSIKELSRFSLPLFPTTFLIMLNVSLAQIMLRKYVDFANIGIYSNAVTIAALITIVQSGLNAFWTPFVYEYYRKPSKIQKMHHVFSLLMFIMAFLIIIMQDVIYFFLVDEDYWASKAIIALLLISPVSDVLAETLGLGIELSKKTYLKLPVYIINILVNVVACILLIPKYGIFGAAVANAVASLSMLISKSVIGEHFYRCSDNYFRLITSMTLLISAGLINYYCHRFIYIYAVIALITVFILYQKETRMLFCQTKEYFLNKNAK